jgi:hypothetical protein
MDGDRFWPFEVLPPEKRTPLHQKQIDFLEVAHRDGFRPYIFGSENFGASAGERSGSLIRRTRQFWELLVGSPVEGGLSAYVAGFDVNAEAVLRWLRGSALSEVLEFVQPHLVPAGGRSSGFRLEPPTGVVAPDAEPVAAPDPAT